MLCRWQRLKVSKKVLATVCVLLVQIDASEGDAVELLQSR